MLGVVVPTPRVVIMINRASQTRPTMTGPPPVPPQPQTSPRWTRVLLMMLVATVVSGGAGVLAHAAGNNVPASVLTAGGAFAAALGLLLAIAHYAGTE